MARINAEPNARWRDIAAIGVDREPPNRGAARFAGWADGTQRNFFNRGHQRCRGHHGIAPPGHGGTAMGFSAFNRHLIPSLRQGMRHHANILAGILQQRTLFDMQFEIGGKISQARRVGVSAPADARQFIAESLAVTIVQRQHISLREDPHRAAAAHHGGRKARPFLIGPIDQHQGRFGLDPRFMQSAQHFKPGQHTKRAVKLPASWLRIQMAAHGNWLALRVAPFATQHHIAEAIHGKGAPNRLPPTAQQMAAFGIKIRQSLPIAATFRRTANLGEFHQAIPKPGAGKGQVCCAHGAFSTPHHSAMVSAMVRVMSCMESRPTLSSMP